MLFPAVGVFLRTRSARKRQEEETNKAQDYEENGYRDAGSFTSVPQKCRFLDRLHLIAIDELHLCAKDNWGGIFRPAVGCLHLLRQQYKAHTCIFGKTATLTTRAWTEVKISAVL
jgi:superfamily II DNA helicase RecQ